MNKYYFIINPLQHILITEQTQESAICVFQALSSTKKYHYIQPVKPKKSELIEAIIERKIA